MHDHACVESENTLYLAGERVVAGFYRQLDAHVTVHFEQDDFLPATLDGHVACYVRIVAVQHLFSARSAVVQVKTRSQEDIDVQEDTRVR